MSRYIEPFQTSANDLELLGGKGRSLTNLVNHGFSVPSGFHVTTRSYKRFISVNDLQGRILDAAQPELANQRASFEKASSSIRELIESATIHDDLVADIQSSYESLGAASKGDLAVAVRSSANAEDLADLSFAGQQETYLNVRGAQEVVAAVKKCWASLWTPQALNYRHQNGIGQDSVAMSVVLQTQICGHVPPLL